MAVKQLVVHLSVPVYVSTTGPDDRVDPDRVRDYLDDVVNGREKLTGAQGQPAAGRLCFNGEVLRDALERWVASVPRALGQEGDVFLGADTSLPGCAHLDGHRVGVAVLSPATE